MIKTAFALCISLALFSCTNNSPLPTPAQPGERAIACNNSRNASDLLIFWTELKYRLGLPASFLAEPTDARAINAWLDNPGNAVELATVKKLEIVDSNFRSLPHQFSKLTGLQNLTINNTQLRALPQVIETFSKLETLDLQANQLSTLPNLGALKKLVVIDLRNNFISEETIANIRTLIPQGRHFQWDPQRLTSAQEEENRNLLIFWKEVKAQLITNGLDARSLPGDNAFAVRTWFREESFQVHRDAIIRLQLSEKKLSQITPFISTLGNLKDLLLSGNDLREIPNEVYGLVHLKKLALDFNKLSVIGPRIGELGALEVLVLKNNDISSVSTEIIKLRSLKVLFLNENRLTADEIEKIAELKKLGEYYYVSPQKPLSATADMNWHLFGEFGINIKEAWSITRGSPTTRVAIVDRGFLPDSAAYSTGTCSIRPILIDFSVEAPTEKFIDDHGTAVSSVIRSCHDNSLGLVGINTDSPIQWIMAPIYSKTAIGKSGELIKWAAGQNICSTSSAVNCCKANQTPANIINASFGSYALEANAAEFRYTDLSIVENINQHRRILVASSGNNSRNSDVHFPSNMTGVISVGATQRNGEAASFSSWGKSVEIMAPGKDIPVAGIFGLNITEGTSFAAPIITGVISLMHAVFPEINWKRAVYLLQSTATPMNCQQYCSPNYAAEAQTQCQQDCCGGDPNGPQICTPGRVNAGEAVRAAQIAQENFAAAVPVGLLDSDKYLVKLTVHPPETVRRGEFTLSNVGARKADYTLSSADGKLTFDYGPSLDIEINPNEKIKVNVSTTSQWGQSSFEEGKLVIKSKEAIIRDLFHDELNIYVQ